jgi:hypothetical protein
MSVMAVNAAELVPAGSPQVVFEFDVRLVVPGWDFGDEIGKIFGVVDNQLRFEKLVVAKRFPYRRAFIRCGFSIKTS